MQFRAPRNLRFSYEKMSFEAEIYKGFNPLAPVKEYTALRRRIFNLVSLVRTLLSNPQCRPQ